MRDCLKRLAPSTEVPKILPVAATCSPLRVEDARPSHTARSPSPSGRGRSSSVTWPCIFFVGWTARRLRFVRISLEVSIECLSVLRRSHRGGWREAPGEGRGLFRGSLTTNHSQQLPPYMLREQPMHHVAVRVGEIPDCVAYVGVLGVPHQPARPLKGGDHGAGFLHGDDVVLGSVEGPDRRGADGRGAEV